VTHDGADHGERNTRIAASGLDNRLARLERTAVSSILNDGVGQPVFDRGHGIEGLDLHIHIDVIRRNPV